GDPVPILHHRLVLHVRADLPQVVLGRRPGSHRPAFYKVRGDQELGAVADGRDQLAALLESLDEVDHALVDAEVIGRLAAGDEQGVVVLGAHLVDRLLGLDLFLPLVALELLAGLHADDVDLVALLLEAVVRDAELGILETLTQNTGDLHRGLLRWAARWAAVPDRGTPETHEQNEFAPGARLLD